MLIFIDSKAPEAAKLILRNTGKVIEFETEGLCYDAISGHPDVFFFQHPNGLIIAPNTPLKYKNILKDNKIQFIEGELPVGIVYPQTACYNALYTSYGVLHNSNFSDSAIKRLQAKTLHCKQGYVRCNTIKVGDLFLTSDHGIESVLIKQSFKVFHVDPQSIELKGFRNGFFGGCCGIWEKKLYCCGSLHSIPNADELIKLIHHEGYSIVELNEGALIDVGGIFFIPSQ
jgi:hypothetical protein